jgi:tRNA isopentenyl-2-thiomethyl-A-37 hydroxylase MiaE
MIALAELAPHVGLKAACRAFAMNRGVVYRDRVQCNRSIAFVIRTLRHWSRGNQVKANERSSAFFRLSATARCLRHHSRMSALQRVSISLLVAAYLECRSNPSFEALLLTACVIVNCKSEWP